jgi:hypothetical protein
MLLFMIVALSFCNVVISLGFGFFLKASKPLPEWSAFFVHFRYLVTSLAIFLLVAGGWAFVASKRALAYIYFLVWLQLVILTYTWISTLYFLAK